MQSMSMIASLHNSIHIVKVNKKALKYRFYPTLEQVELLAQTFGCVRVVYNNILDWRTKQFYEKKEKIYYIKANARLTALKSYVNYNDDDLLAQITGIDRGVVLPACTSEGTRHAYSPAQVAKLKAIAKKKAHYQRVLARKKRLNKNKNKYRCESNVQQRLANKISKLDNKTANIRENFCHTMSKEIVVQAKPIISLEDLKLKNMTRKAKPKHEKTGRKFIRNNGRAKSGLNLSLLNVALGRLGTFITYKANDYGKAVVEINPAYTSRTCHVCQDRNTVRPNQATLICLNGCGAFNADENAAMVIAQRAVSYIKESKFADKAKTRKKTAIRKNTKAKILPLVEELTSVKKSGELEAAPLGVSLTS